jgi:hypothetical protein
MRVAVLGCGPAGLVAAHGALMAGAEDVRIFSKKRKSELFGAQYLHAPIPGATGKAPIDIAYELRGTIDGYRQKVYGLKDDVEVSVETLSEFHPAWDLRDTYNYLWECYSSYVVDVEIRAHDATFGPKLGCDLVLSTIPATALCFGEHTFGYEEIWAAGDAPERGTFVPYSAPKRTVVCNGEESPAWYRISNIFGHQTVEWPGDIDQPPVEGVARVRKPLHNNCDCHPDIVRLGRYGAWTKGILVHDVYAGAQMAVQERG